MYKWLPVFAIVFACMEALVRELQPTSAMPMGIILLVAFVALTVWCLLADPPRQHHKPRNVRSIH